MTFIKLTITEGYEVAIDFERVEMIDQKNGVTSVTFGSRTVFVKESIDEILAKIALTKINAWSIPYTMPAQPYVNPPYVPGQPYPFNPQFGSTNVNPDVNFGASNK